MAIAYDNATIINAGTVSSVTGSHTCSGSDRILIVHVSHNGTASHDSVTYNGVALTKIADVVESRRLSVWYLIAPSTGSNDVVVTFGGSSPNVRCGAISYTGAKQSAQPDSFNSDQNGSGTISTTVVADNCWLIGAFYDDSLATLTGSATVRINNSYTITQDSNGVVGTGSQSSVVTGGTASDVLSIAVSIAPTAGTAYSITTSVGSFVLTGIATVFSASLNMVASAGSFVLTGFDVLYALGKGISAEVGSFILTGNNATLTSVRSMVASVGSFTLTGIAVLFTLLRRIVAETGTFVLTGFDAILRSSKTWFSTQTKTVVDWVNQNKS